MPGRLSIRCSRGQIEGGIAQAIAAALYEELLDNAGGIPNPSFRNYHVPAVADIPRTKVLFAQTTDRLGPFGPQVDERKPVQSGCCRISQRCRRGDRHPLSNVAIEGGSFLAALLTDRRGA
jgi:hypothetical protein